MVPDPDDETRAVIRDQAREVGRGWSGPDADPGWALVAALFDAVATDDALVALAAEIPLPRLPALLLVASIQRAVADHPETPLARYYPGPAQRPTDAGFGLALRSFVDEHVDDVRRWFGRYYQMNEVGRSVQSVLALGVVQASAPGRPIALVDVGAGSGLGLHLDRYHVDLGGGRRFGPASSAVRLVCAVDGDVPVPPGPPDIVERVGIDVAPIDLDDVDAVAWLGACLPPVPGATDRLAGAVEITRAAGAPILEGDGAARLPGVLASLTPDAVVVVVDSYTAVFLDETARAAIRSTVETCGRDAVWISLDPLVPLGTAAQRCVHGLPVDPAIVARNRAGGVFALLSVVGAVGGRRVDQVLATAHPSGTRMTWIA